MITVEFRSKNLNKIYSELLKNPYDIFMDLGGNLHYSEIYAYAFPLHLRTDEQFIKKYLSQLGTYIYDDFNHYLRGINEFNIFHICHWIKEAECEIDYQKEIDALLKKYSLSEDEISGLRSIRDSFDLVNLVLEDWDFLDIPMYIDVMISTDENYTEYIEFYKELIPFDKYNEYTRHVEKLQSKQLDDDTRIIEVLISLCLMTQEVQRICTGSENDINDYIRNLLSTKGLNVSDQTRRGLSATGISSGSIDILIKNNEDLPRIIIEALILNNCETKKISEHINKIFNYDSNGLKNNVVLSYCRAENYVNLIDKYKKFVSSNDFVYPQTNIRDISNEKYSEIRVIKSQYVRSSMSRNLYHILLNINKYNN